MQAMGFKRRLVMAFLIILIVPMILIAATGMVVVNYQLNSIQKTYDVESDTLQIITNPMNVLSRMTRRVYEVIRKSGQENADNLLNNEFLLRLNEELKSTYSFLVVNKGSETVYIGDNEKYDMIKDEMPAGEVYDNSENLNTDSGVYISGTTSFLIKQQNYTAGDGILITVYIITDVSTVIPQLKVSLIQTITIIGLIILLTAGILVVWLYRSVVRPLNVLTVATKRMKAGDLDFTISGDPEDELGQLCEDFEEMRVHLKELIDVRLQYEKDTIELISNISHDLKTPLTAIKGYTEGIIDGVADSDEKREKYLKTIYTKAVDMSVLVDELAFYTKIDSNIVPYNFSILPVDEYFEDCVEELSLDMEVKNVKLSYKSSLKNNRFVLADPEQLRRVINNVIGNSVKYMDKPEGKIEIRSKELGEYIQIEIEDNGAGIADEELPLIFDRFYRADASRNSKMGGTGLGLAIAMKIIEEHSGRIWATSRINEGTTILFTLPMYREDTEVKIQAEVPVKRAMLQRVLDRSRNKKEKREERDGKNTDS